LARRKGTKSGDGKHYLPERGDLVWLDFSPQAGHKQAGRRPALVLSPAPYNKKAGLAVCCPVTNQIKGYPFEVQIPEGHKVAGAVLADQVRSMDWRRRNAERIEPASPELVQDVVAKIAALIEAEEAT
jgi:mRNA interferase MazF